MLIQVNTDNHISGSEELRHLTEGVVGHAFRRFGEQITRVEVYFTDEDSSERATEADKRCLIEVRLAGLKPMAASERGASIEQALNAATDTMVETLDRTLGRLQDTKQRRPGKAA